MMYELYMKINKPVNELTGKNHNVQGFTVLSELGQGIVLFHTGVCAVYDLAAKAPESLGVFKLGSYNNGTPDNRYTNHANDCMFGNKLPGEKYPLLYVTAGNSGEFDEKGYIAYCAVEQISEKNGVFSSKTVQKIYYHPKFDGKTNYTPLGWGWPASLVDVKNNRYYTFSAKNRTKREFAHLENEYIITEFILPPTDKAEVTLTAYDIIGQFTVPYNVFFTQGGTVHDEKLYYTFGCGKAGYVNALRGIDLKTKQYFIEDEMDTPDFQVDEVECVGFLNGRLLINMQSGKIYERRLKDRPFDR